MAMPVDIDSIDWNRYPPERVEGIKYFYRGPTSDEDGPCSDEELKMLCIKWECKVDMKIDNFLFWLMKKTFERDYKGDRERFLHDIPKMTRALRKKGLAKYNAYQDTYGEKNRQYLAHCADWRLMELRRLRWLDRLRALSSTWSLDNSEEEEESDTESKFKDNDTTNFSSNSSVMTVIDTLNRYNSYLETESVNPDIPLFDDIGREEEIGHAIDIDNDDIEDINTQLFVPGCTSTQNK